MRPAEDGWSMIVVVEHPGTAKIDGGLAPHIVDEAS
jgi:hypothetical protein